MTDLTRFKGAFTALITPFNGRDVEEKTFKTLVERQISMGIHGLVPCGTTGESPTLNHDEHNRVTELCVQIASGRVPVMAGTGSNSTREAIALTQHAEKCGADAALIATPYYNKPTQAGLYAHYKAIHDETNIPLFIYNIPGRSVVDMSDDTMEQLAQLPRIVGNKDATGDMARPAEMHKRLGERFIQISGEDETVLPFNKAGGVGVISVSSNVVPDKIAEVQTLSLAGKDAEAEALQAKLTPLHQAMFSETSPGPVKYAMHLMGLCDERYRLPLVPISDENKAKVKVALEALELI